MDNLLRFIIKYKVVIVSVLTGALYNSFKDPKILVMGLILVTILSQLNTITQEDFKIFQSVTDRNFFCKAIDKVATKCQGHIKKNNCQKGSGCNDCEKFTYHLNKTRKLLNSIIHKNFNN